MLRIGRRLTVRKTAEETITKRQTVTFIVIKCEQNGREKKVLFAFLIYPMRATCSSLRFDDPNAIW